jgi:CBS domain containing-hemolysin-like protein
MDETSIGIRLLVIVTLLGVNAFFAGAEVSLISSRRAKLRALAERGNVGAQAALNLLGNPERLLSVIQVGVTLASLGLGWAGESTFLQFVAWLLGSLVPTGSGPFFRGLCFALAFVMMGYLHVVIGEVVPKNLGLEKTERLAVLSAPPLLVFYRACLPFVYAIERTSILISGFLGLRRTPHGGGHSAEELRWLVHSSREAGHLQPFEEAAIQRVLGLRDYLAREAMVPRHQVISIPLHATLEQTLRAANQHRRSRYPIYDGSPENIVGILLAKDLLREWEDRRRATELRRSVRPFHLQRFLRKPLIIPETKPLSELIEDFRKARIHMAVVVDEFGTVSGIITLEDVLEQVFGEIEDETDLVTTAPVAGSDVLDMNGSVSIRDLQAYYGIELPAGEGFETLAGFVLYRLGRVPEPGDSFTYEGKRFTVLAMDRNRVAKVRIERLAEDADAGVQRPA